ncbi:hypothetical protein SPV_2541 [Streptococcus pneumoniae]|nr:hypothetical protein SPV_2541 [Streptococcus pneumoniae]
MIYHRLE